MQSTGGLRLCNAVFVAFLALLAVEPWALTQALTAVAASSQGGCGDHGALQTVAACGDPACSGHGVCQEDSSCTCDYGWEGEACDSILFATCVGGCPLEGHCDQGTGLCMCSGSPCPAEAQTTQANEDAPQAASFHIVARAANPPNCSGANGAWNASLGACVCDSAWHGTHCELKNCPDWDPSSGQQCSGQGRCIFGECLCDEGWGLAPGGEGPNVCKDVACQYGCGAHGNCTEGKCACEEGWQGTLCRDPHCAGGCSGHGVCTFVAPGSPAECLCDDGYSSSDCSVTALFSKLLPCPRSCSGHGLCFDGACMCDDGFSGEDCAGHLGQGGFVLTCPRDCAGHGLCFAGECVCHGSHGGPDCSIPASCLSACDHACLPDTSSEGCTVCKGRCLLELTQLSGDSADEGAPAFSVSDAFLLQVKERRRVKRSARELSVGARRMPEP